MSYALLAAAAIALLSLLGGAFWGNRKFAERIERHILPIAAGTFLSVAFFDLIPEALREASELGSYAIAAGFLFFYALAHMLRTYHHHHGEDCTDEGTKAAASMVLIGDAIHNFADGIVIAAAFMVDPAVGLATTLGIALHEIPQEIAEFGILIRAGYSRAKALLYNLLSAASVVVGAAIAYASLSYAEGLIGILVGIAAVNLLYIAASDIIPDLHHAHEEHGAFWRSFTTTMLAMIIMSSLLTYTHNRFAHEDRAENSVSLKK
jgi:zinc and cadmium transporter